MPQTLELQTVSRDGTSVYVMPHPDGLGATVDQALADGQPTRHVIICGARPGAGVSGARSFVEQRGRWQLWGEPHITRSALRLSVAGVVDEQTAVVRVSRIEPWFGEHVEPEHASEAMRYVRNVCGAVGVRPAGTPGQTGRALLRAVWDRAGASYPAVSSDVAELLRATSGQGRFELFDAGRAGGQRLVAVDARFQYGALAQLELPVGEPVELTGEPDDQYAPAWCHVEFVPAAGPVGVLGVHGIGGWWYPTDGGPHRTWCTGAEVLTARRAGYRVRVLRAIVWPQRARPLATWARLLSNGRERVASLPVADGVKSASRDGLRAILVQSIGTMHRPPASSVLSASADKTEGAGGFVFEHPEWSAQIWGIARARLAGVMLRQTAPVVACALDGLYVAGEPVVEPDNGRPGAWRVQWSGGPFGPLSSMADLYAVKDGAPA